MKRVISLILIIILIYFCYSINKQHFQSSTPPPNPIDFKRNSHFIFQKNLFYRIGDKTKDILTNNFKDKIDLDKNNLVLPSGFTIKDKLCIDNVCVKASNLQQFIEPDITPKFYKECKNYKRPLKSTESASIDTDWKDKDNHDCVWYENNPTRCQKSDDNMPGPGSDFNGIGAKDACCICKSSTDITSSQDLNDKKYYSEINYNNDSKTTKPDYLCMNDDEYVIVYSDKRPTDILGRLKKQSNNFNDRPHWKGTSPNLELKYYNNKWVIIKAGSNLHSQPTNLMKPNNTLIWNTVPPSNQPIPIKISYNKTCINGQNFRTINGSKTINIKSEWDSSPDYIRPYNIELGDGNKASGVRDYVFFQKDNDVDNDFVNYSKKYPGTPGIRTCSENIIKNPDNTSRANCLISPDNSPIYIGKSLNNSNTKIKKIGNNWVILGITKYYYNNSSSYTIPIGGKEKGWYVSVNNNGLAADVIKNPNQFTCNLRRGRNYLDTSLRVNTHGDVECYTSNNRECAWNQCFQNEWGPRWRRWRWMIRRWSDPKHALTCGSEHRNIWGGGGYSNTTHWCYQAAEQFGKNHNMKIAQDPTNKKKVTISGHMPRSGINDVNGDYETTNLGEHYCEKAGISKDVDEATTNDYGLDYIILPGKKSKNTLTNIDKYKHAHTHGHNNSPHTII